MTITINNINHQIPQSWNELTLKQQLTIYHILLSNMHGLLPDVAENIATKRIAIAQFLLGLTNTRKWRLDLQSEYGAEDGDTLFIGELDAVARACTDWLFERIEEKEGYPEQYRIEFGLTKTPWPQIEYKNRKSGKKKIWCGPADALANVTIYELGMAFYQFEEYLRTKQIEHLNRLLAILWRPSKPSTPENRRSGYEGDHRLPLLKHEAMIPKRMKKIAGLPKEVKQLLLFWFASCRMKIIEAYPNIFKAPPAAGERVGNDYSWGGVLLSLAGGLVHLDAVAQHTYSNAFTYLSYLEDQRIEQERELLRQRQQQRR